MRKKTIKAMLRVYAALCLTYGALHGIDIPASSQTSEDLQKAETSASETHAAVTTVPETVTEKSTEETSAESRKHGRSTKTSADLTEESTKLQTETQTETTTQAPEETYTQPPETTVTEAPETYIETEPETEYTEEYTEEIEEIPEPQPYVPSLDEYLRGFTCSGCRHNCSLANPRCMNGARKASQAESDYYSIYG